MAHFAKIGLDNKVLEVVRVDNRDCMTPEGVEQESIGIDYLQRLTGHDTWKQCSFNTYEGEHLLGGTPMRKNFPNTEFIYDSNRDAFINPNKLEGFDSWVFNEDKGAYVAPVDYPDDGKRYKWDDTNVTWAEMAESEYYI